MPSPESGTRRILMVSVLIQEFRGLLLSPSLWVMLCMLSVLTGYSFIQAVTLFSQASQTAVSFPELARGMNPLTGIFVPTFGAYYLTQTLLLPFVAIRLIGLDRQSGALKLLLQLDLSPLALCSVKVFAMAGIWLITLIPAISVLVFWLQMGGHVHWPEIAVLLAGHGLYAFTVITLAMFVAAFSDSLPTAAMICLGFTLGLWVLDFTASGQGGILGFIGELSLAPMLRHFENGLLATSTVFVFFVFMTAFFSLAVLWLQPAKGLAIKIFRSVIFVVVTCLALICISYIPGYMDVTENRIHSFNPSDKRALQQLSKPLHIILHLNAQDSRLQDMKKGILAKLQRTVDNLHFLYIQDSSGGMFAASEDKDYGIIEYKYGNQHELSYSNSEEEILSIIYKLADITVVPDVIPAYPGYPLVTKRVPGKWWFFGFLPALCLGCAVFFSFFRKKKYFIS